MFKLRDKRTTLADWIGLVAGAIIALSITEIIRSGGISSSKEIIPFLGSSLPFVIFALIISTLFNRRISIGINILMTIAIISFLKSAVIYLEARHRGLFSTEASLYMDSYFITLFLLTWGLYWLIKNILKKLILHG